MKMHCAAAFRRFCAVFLAALMIATAASAVEPPLGEDQIRDAISGNTATLHSADLEVIKAYFAPDGELRGRYDGEDFTGSWSVENDSLCLNSPATMDLCHTVVRRDGTLQLFTKVGEPAGYFRVEQGNPEDF